MSLKCLFSIIRPTQIEDVAEIDLNQHHTIDVDFEVRVPTEQHWDAERWREELSRKKCKGVLVTDGPHILGAFIYEFTEHDYKLIRLVRNEKCSSKITSFLDYVLMWLCDKMEHEQKSQISVLLPDESFDTLREFTKFGWVVESQRDYFGDGLDYWLVTHRNKKVFNDARS